MKSRIRFCAVTVLVATPLFAGCAAFHTPKEVDQTLQATLAAARSQHQKGRDVEAAQLIEGVLRIHGKYPGARRLRRSLSPDIAYLYDHPYLGSNFARRTKVERSTRDRVLLYLPDRILDALDTVSFDLHFGPGAYANVHVTRGFQFGAGVRGVGGVGWHDHRSLGLLGQAEAGFALPAVGVETYAGSVVGTSGIFSSAGGNAGLHKPSSRVYQQFRDFWAVGAAFTLGAIGVEVDFHPVQLADFLLGIGGLDILHDDFAYTTGLRLTRSDRELLRDLSEMERSRKTMETYEYHLSGPGR
jgi:hypothetical protein